MANRRILTQSGALSSFSLVELYFLPVNLQVRS